MLEAVIQDLIRQQRPYYLLQGSSVKGIGGQYWLVFQHRGVDIAKLSPGARSAKTEAGHRL